MISNGTHRQVRFVAGGEYWCGGCKTAYRSRGDRITTLRGSSEPSTQACFFPADSPALETTSPKTIAFDDDATRSNCELDTGRGPHRSLHVPGTLRPDAPLSPREQARRASSRTRRSMARPTASQRLSDDPTFRGGCVHPGRHRPTVHPTAHQIAVPYLCRCLWALPVP